MNEIKFKPIGVIHSPIKKKEDAPIQSCKSDKVGEIELFEEYREALKDIEGFSHLYLIYHFHRAGEFRPMVKPFLDDKMRGLFATRYFNRPNPIGLSVVELLEVNGNILKVKGVDMLEGTPLLDIKPYVPYFDARDGVSIGWLERKFDNAEK